jgi:hypothetical protein
MMTHVLYEQKQRDGITQGIQPCVSFLPGRRTTTILEKVCSLSVLQPKGSTSVVSTHVGEIDIKRLKPSNTFYNADDTYLN